MDMYGPRSLFSNQIHAEKYRAPGETFREAMTRLSSACSDNDEHFATIREINLNQRFLAAGRVQAAMGATRLTTAHNCFVSGVIEDSYTEGSGSIMERAKQAAKTMRMGGGIGYDFSTLRPNGSLIRKLGSKASGPVSFMTIFDAVCKTTASAGDRRGAQMGVLRVDHPDIEEFVRAKTNDTALTGFNISVAITDEFMQAVEMDRDFPLQFDGQVHKVIKARALWDVIMRNTYDWAEPGVIFIDTVNDRNNLYYCEQISTTNPCGEQPLPPHGACLLGSFNLVKYLFREGPDHPWSFNYTQLFRDIPPIVRMMDNIVDRAHYPLYEQEREAQSKRRMGLGVTGAANTIEALGYHYGSEGFIRQLSTILSGIRRNIYEASSDLAKEKGAFPLFNRDKYVEADFIRGLEPELIERIYKNGIRNSHLLSIAPTGTISLTADNVSSGIEPVYAYDQYRIVFTNNGPEEVTLEDYGKKYLGNYGKTADMCSADDHLRVLICASQNVDSAVSKTCNVHKEFPWDDFKSLYTRAWEANCKGCTTFRTDSLRAGILRNTTNENADPNTGSCTINPETGVKSCE